MKKETPTAEEFLKREDLPTDMLSGDDINFAMIEFAKMHVRLALENALEDSPTGSSTDIPSYEDMKDAILNAYPEENIK